MHAYQMYDNCVPPTPLICLDSPAGIKACSENDITGLLLAVRTLLPSIVATTNPVASLAAGLTAASKLKREDNCHNLCELRRPEETCFPDRNKPSRRQGFSSMSRLCIVIVVFQN